MLNINKNTAIRYRFTFVFFYFQLDDKSNFIDAVLNKIKTKASARSIRKIIADFIIAKEEQIYIVYNNFFEKKRCTMDGLISLILKEGNVPLFMYDFLTILLGDFLNVKIALICAVGVFTNVANVLQQDMNDEEFIIVICQSGTIFTLAGENSNKIRLGVSPLCSFFAKQMRHMNVNVASSHQKHSSIQEASTESTQDGGVPEELQVVEVFTESTQDGGVLESWDEESPVVKAFTESTQDGGVPEESQVVEASTELTQDVGVLESRDEESPVIEASTKSTQDVGVLESRDEELPVVEVSTELTQDVGVLEESQVVEASTELTQDGVNTNKSNERKSSVVKKNNIDGNAFFPSADTEDDFDCFVVNTHDASFEMDALDRQLMTLNLNLSSNSIRSVTQMKSQAHDVTDSSLDEFTGFHPTDIPSSDTEMTDNSITISDDDDDDSTSHTTATAEFLDADDNLSNFSNAVPPSVAESDDITVTFSDADGMSEEISIQTIGNPVPPCHDDSTDDFSEDEIEKKLLLIRHVPNQIKEIRGSYYGGIRVGKYPTCFKNKNHSMAEIHQKSVEDNYYEEEAENIENNSDGNDHVEPDEKEAENIENNSDDNDHVEPNKKEAEKIENHSIHGDEQAEFPQGQPDKNEAENIENHSIHGDEQAEFPQGQPDENEAENIENHSIHGDEQAEFPQ